MALVFSLTEDIEESDHYRKVVYTGSNCQVVIFHLQPNQELGTETHENTMLIVRVENGSGIATIDDDEEELEKGTVVPIPEDTPFNITASDSDELTLSITYVGEVIYPEDDDIEEKED